MLGRPNARTINIVALSPLRFVWLPLLAMRHRARTDGNHAEIRDLLRKLCPCVEDTSDVGRGFSDLVVKTSRGSIFMVEIKDGSLPPSRRALTEHEEKFKLRWESSYIVVTNEEEAIELSRR